MVSVTDMAKSLAVALQLGHTCGICQLPSDVFID